MIRKAKISDIPALLKLWKNFMNDHDKIVLSRNKKIAPFIKRKKNHIELFNGYVTKCIFSSRSLILVIELDEKLVGYLLCHIKKGIPIYQEYVGYFSDVYIDKKYHGRGLSTKMFLEAEKWFKKKGLKEMTIGVFQDNPHAHAVYKKWGFTDFSHELKKKIK